MSGVGKRASGKRDPRSSAMPPESRSVWLCLHVALHHHSPDVFDFGGNEHRQRLATLSDKPASWPGDPLAAVKELGLTHHPTV